MTAILGGVLLALGVLLFILEPVVSGQRAILYDGEDVYDEAAAKRRIALTALRDLEYDRATGKIEGDDYQRLKAELSREALRHLETRKEEGRPGPGAEGVEQHALGLEQEIARIRAALREGLGCPECEAVNRPGSSFCSTCGATLPGKEMAGASP